MNKLESSTKRPVGANVSHKSLAGFVDQCGGDIISGWAQIPFVSVITAVVDFSIDGEHAGSAKANIFRQDLRDQGIRDGFAGFRFKVPPKFHDNKPHEVIAIERFSRKPLGGITQFQIEVEAEIATRGNLFLTSVNRASSVGEPQFIKALSDRRKLAIFCTFTPSNGLYGYHHEIISELSRDGFAVLLGQSYVDERVDDSSLIVAPQSAADAYVVKDNLGYDFGTWMACLEAVREHLQDLDEVLLVNDSVFGPLSDLRPFFRQARGLEADVVGVCDSYEHNFHLQSFFLLFREKCVKSGFLQRFVDAYPYSNEKDNVIREGELTLTRELMASGFKCAAVYPYEQLASQWLDRLQSYIKEIRNLPENVACKEKQISLPEVDYFVNLGRHIRRGDPVNPSHYFWDILIERGCPFVKRELLFKNPIGHPMLYKAPSVIAGTGYNLELIREAAQRFGTSKAFHWLSKPDSSAG